jgi:hypothetical protein
MTGLRGGKNPKRETVVESHSCAKDAQEWGTLGPKIATQNEAAARGELPDAPMLIRRA